MLQWRLNDNFSSDLFFKIILGKFKSRHFFQSHNKISLEFPRSVNLPKFSMAQLLQYLKISDWPLLDQALWKLLRVVIWNILDSVKSKCSHWQVFVEGCFMLATFFRVIRLVDFNEFWLRPMQAWIDMLIVKILILIFLCFLYCIQNDLLLYSQWTRRRYHQK